MIRRTPQRTPTLAFGPNAYKLAIILTELSLPFETVNIWDAAELKKAPFTDVDPNGRAPVPEKYLFDHWLFVQASGQGPYYGQAGWFNVFHHEKLPSA
ncbi:MAG: hypothetical protein Q9219_007496 [cf. Caloplaca sp. 3 TL-2023]